MAQRIQKAAQSKGYNQRALASASAMSPGRIHEYWNAQAVPSATAAISLANALGVSVEWLVRGSGPKVATADEIDLVEVEQIDLAFGMGGRYADLPVERAVMHFPRAWIENITATPAAQLTFALGRGDSMSPTLQDSDIVLIDRSITRVHEQDAIWALTIGDIAMIKRVRVRGDQVQLLSDNDRVPIDTAEIDEVVIVGRVIFIGRKL